MKSAQLIILCNNKSRMYRLYLDGSLSFLNTLWWNTELHPCFLNWTFISPVRFKNVRNIQRNLTTQLHTMSKEEFRKCFDQRETLWNNFVKWQWDNFWKKINVSFLVNTTSVLIFFNTPCTLVRRLCIMIITVRNGVGDLNSNPRKHCLHFILCLFLLERHELIGLPYHLKQ